MSQRGRGGFLGLSRGICRKTVTLLEPAVPHSLWQGNSQTLKYISYSLTKECPNLCPGALCYVSPVADPPPATNTRVPLLVRGEVGREIDCILPALKRDTDRSSLELTVGDKTFYTSLIKIRWQARKGHGNKLGTVCVFMCWFLPQSGLVLLHSFDPHTSLPPTPSCGRAAESCGAVEDSSRSRRSMASGRWATVCQWSCPLGSTSENTEQQQRSINNIRYSGYTVYKGKSMYLVFIGLLPVANGGLTGHYVEVNMVVTADAPAAPLPRSDTLQLQQHVVCTLPPLASCGKAVHPAIHIHGP